MEYSSANAAFNPPSPPSQRGEGGLFSSPDKGRSGGGGVAGFGARVVSIVKLVCIAACLLVAPLAHAGAVDKLPPTVRLGASLKLWEMSRFSIEEVWRRREKGAAAPVPPREPMKRSPAKRDVRDEKPPVR